MDVLELSEFRQAARDGRIKPKRAVSASEWEQQRVRMPVLRKDVTLAPPANGADPLAVTALELGKDAADVAPVDGISPDMLRQTMINGADGMPVIDLKRRSALFVISDGEIDRDFDTLSAAGWKFAPFMRCNGPWLHCHNRYDHPIGRSFAAPFVAGGRVYARCFYANAEANPEAEKAWQSLLFGSEIATSVGFIPIDWDHPNDPERKWGLDITEQELLEISVLAVQSNRGAVLDGKSFGGTKENGMDQKDKAPAAKTVTTGIAPADTPAEHVANLANLAKSLTDLQDKMGATCAVHDGLMEKAKKIHDGYDAKLKEFADLHAKMMKALDGAGDGDAASSVPADDTDKAAAAVSKAITETLVKSGKSEAEIAAIVTKATVATLASMGLKGSGMKAGHIKALKGARKMINGVLSDHEAAGGDGDGDEDDGQAPKAAPTAGTKAPAVAVVPAPVAEQTPEQKKAAEALKAKSYLEELSKAAQGGDEKAKKKLKDLTDEAMGYAVKKAKGDLDAMA